MALIHCNFYSEALGLSTAMYVILPEQTRTQIGMEGKAAAGKHQTLYLLHGLSDDYTIWQRRTSIERYAASLGLAVVMPAVHRSFYTDMKQGYKYWSFVSEELPRVARSFFPLSDKREDNFVAGLSMGGYGAFKLALNCPAQFAAGASLSGAMDMANHVFNEEEYRLVFGSPEETKGSLNDLYFAAAQTANSAGPKPKLYQCCGTEDFLYEENVQFRDYARDELKLDLTYEEESGEHEWGYWDQKIQRVLEWLPLKK